MTTYCQLLPRSLSEEMLQLAVQAICDRPGEGPAQFEARAHVLIHTVVGCAPRDGLEHMLATLIVGHFYLQLDAMHGAFHSEPEKTAAASRSVLALDRGLSGMLRELRAAQTRPLAPVPAEATADTQCAAPSPDSEAVAEPASAAPPGPEQAAISGGVPPHSAAAPPSGPAQAVSPPVPPQSAAAACNPAAGSPLPAWTAADDALLQRFLAGEALLAAVQQSLIETQPDDIPLPEAAVAD